MRSRAASISLNVIKRSQSCARFRLRQATADRRQSTTSTALARLIDIEAAETAVTTGSRIESLAYFDRQLLGIEWLWQEKHSRLASIARLKRFFEIAGDKKNFDVGLSGAKRIGETAAAHLRHYQVGEKEINFSSAVFSE